MYLLFIIYLFIYESCTKKNTREKHKMEKAICIEDMEPATQLGFRVGSVNIYAIKVC